jgi:hypothetical protein
MNNLTEKQAFLAMIFFLEQYYQQTESDDVGALLSSLQLLEDGMTADPAMWDDWLEVISRTLSNQLETVVKI